MSIETDIKRIADATEKILAILTPIQKVEVITASTEIKPPVMIQKIEEVEKITEPSEDEIRSQVREYMNANGKEKAIELLIKHGAKAEKPMIKDVVNKIGLMQELKNGKS